MRAVLRWAAIGAGLVLVLTAGLCLASYRKFSANITTDSAAEQVLAEYAAQRPPIVVPQARNILVLGADTPSAPRTAAARGDAAADTAVLLHLSADRTRAVAVVVPRGLNVTVPGCRLPGGGSVPAAYEPLAAAFRGGGAACSIRAFEQLSGVRVDHHLVVDLPRFDLIAAAVGDGTRDRDAGTSPGQDAERGAGRDPRENADASAQGNAHGPADGSPDRTPGRTPDGNPGADPRRDLLRALAGAGGSGSFAHPARLFGLLDTATSAITADPGLSSLPALYELAGVLRGLPAGGVTLVTLPMVPGGGNVLRHPAVDRLFSALRADRPLAMDAGP